MRIYEMTATFGCLEHETLKLEPGLNLLERPNEWGKSTWCAFLEAMFYGLDTRERSTKTALAAKEKYTPWSGSPMAGRIDLNWNGRDITIQRRTKGRVPLGEFSVFETASGLPVPELTAANCGQQLLGVEQSVFRRAGFLRLTELPVTQDEALRRRLNALVTTGDDSGEADRLAGKLRELKNKCKFNRTGALPQAQAELQAVERTAGELEESRKALEKLEKRHEELEEHLSRLKNHQAALRYQEAQGDADRVAAAETAAEQARQWEQTMAYSCRELPSRETAEAAVKELKCWTEQWQALQMESRMLPSEPARPEIPVPFLGMAPERAEEQAQADGERYEDLNRPTGRWIAPVLALSLVCLLAGVGLWLANTPWGIYLTALGAAALAAALTAGAISLSRRKERQREGSALAARYGSCDPEDWLDLAQTYAAACARYRRELASCRQARGDLEDRMACLEEQMKGKTNGQEPQMCLAQWEQVCRAWQSYDDARRDRQRLERTAGDLKAMARTAQPPEQEDSLTNSAPETARLVSDCEDQLRQLSVQKGRLQERMAALGTEEDLNRRISALEKRISQLEDYYGALELAERSLAQAAAQLQRRFAPAIARRAEELFRELTGGRYDRLRLLEDLSVDAGGAGEDTLRSPKWRSDGTADQLYVALRLAVSEVLTPEAPLILDDALARFDDDRLRAALAILKEQSCCKQILLFTCQSREGAALRK